MRFFSGLLAGLIFGFGLILSQMVNPAKVQNFLDVFGIWDPSLAFVMGGAIAVTLPGYWLLKKTDGPLFADLFQFPTASQIDNRLLGGAVMFGVGWGIAGFCPGPAIVALPFAKNGSLVFFLALLIGMSLAKIFLNNKRANVPA